MKKTNGKIHYKKIQIKQITKKENTENPNINININNHHPKNDLNLNLNIEFQNTKATNKLYINPQKNNIKINNNKNIYNNEEYDEDNNFNLDDINNQLDEILENIENDGIDEINKKIKYLGEDKKMLNTISNNEEKDNSLYRKIDNKNKKKYERNKINLNTENNINNNYNKQHFYHNDNKNISNNRYLFTSVNNNTYRYLKEENNCIDDDDEDDNYLNRTNISLFYKYNKINNFNKSNNYYEYE